MKYLLPSHFKKIRGIIAIILITTLMSCQQQKRMDSIKPVSKDDYLEPGKEYVHIIADSLRTPEQQAVFDRINQELPRIIDEYVVVEDSLLVLKMTRNEFAKTGIPEQYYDLLLKDLQNINYFYVSGKLDGQSLTEIWDSGKPYKKSWESNTPTGVQMTLTPNRFKATDKKIVSYTITNHSADTINFGNYFHVERKENGSWVKVPFLGNVAFEDILFGLVPEESFKKDMYISAFIGDEHTKKGLYRITKDISLFNNRDSVITVSAEFVVD